MTAREHGSTTRIHVRRLLLAAALHLVSLSCLAASSGNIGRANIAGNGNSVTVTQATVNSGGSTIPVSPNVGGWTQAGNYGVPPTASGTTMNRTVNGETIISGVRYPFQAGYSQPWSGLVGPAIQAAGTMGCSLVTSGIMTAACMAAVPYIWSWVTASGGHVNAATGGFEMAQPGFCSANCFYWIVGSVTGAVKQTTPALACSQAAQAWISGGTGTMVGSACSGPWGGTRAVQTAGSRPADTGSGYLPASMNDIAPYMASTTPPSGNVVGDILGAGQTIPDVVPTVTGPASVQGPDSTTVNPDGTKQSSRTTYNFTTAGNTITNTTNVTTTNNYNAAGAVTNTTTKTDTPAATSTNTGVAAQTPDQQTDCDKYPNSLGCSTLDTPAGTIPRSTQTVTFTPEDYFGSGSCPADATMAFTTLHGQTAKVVDWTTFCGMALPFRAVVMGLAALMAFFIIMPGGKVE